ncbi:uncharacterized protein [Diabrotica undecimpunctata]|uniref:uncharacterized protein n=1 Tax=Diabrotica undecimpunctata TaxID=50387 RepID=UPI003B6357AF
MLLMLEGNGIGANNQLIELAQNTAQKLNISWNFNAPASPHLNGFAEAGVKSFKSYFYRVTGNQILTFEEFYTVLTQIEAILNSRPLCPISTDPNDLQPLTPGQFLVFESLNNPIPEPNLDHLSLNKLSRWQLLQSIQSDFWKRWSLEYINTLQQRHKWTKQSPPVSKGDLVIIKNDQQAPFQWELGRIVNVFPGQDDVIRVVKVKTSRGTMKTPVVKICPLLGN